LPIRLEVLLWSKSKS